VHAPRETVASAAPESSLARTAAVHSRARTYVRARGRWHIGPPPCVAIRPQPTAACRGGGQRSADHAPAAYLARTYVRARVISCANSHGFGEARTCDSVRREATEPPPDCLAKAALVLLVGLDEFEESADFEVFLGRVAHVPMLVDAVVVAAAVALALHVSGFD
jgi:hypothetical protein